MQLEFAFRVFHSKDGYEIVNSFFSDLTTLVQLLNWHVIAPTRRHWEEEGALHCIRRRSLELSHLTPREQPRVPQVFATTQQVCEAAQKDELGVGEDTRVSPLGARGQPRTLLCKRHMQRSGGEMGRHDARLLTPRDGARRRRADARPRQSERAHKRLQTRNKNERKSETRHDTTLYTNRTTQARLEFAAERSGIRTAWSACVAVLSQKTACPVCSCPLPSPSPSFRRRSRPSPLPSFLPLALRPPSSNTTTRRFLKTQRPETWAVSFLSGDGPFNVTFLRRCVL